MAHQAGVISPSQRTAARVVGVAYPLLIALIFVAEFGMYGPLATGDPAAAMRNIAASEGFFRLGIVCALVFSVGVVVVLTALYAVLKPIGPSTALLAALLRLVYVLTWIPIALSLLTLLRLATGADPGSAVGGSAQDLFKLQNGVRHEMYFVGLLFWGLASAVCCVLWIKSRYVPWALPAFGLFASIWCACWGIAYLLDPRVSWTVSQLWYDFPLGLFELVLSLWLLFKGLREPGGPGVPAAG